MTYNNDYDYNYQDEEEVDVRTLKFEEDDTEEEEVDEQADLRKMIDDEDIISCLDDARVPTRAPNGKRKRKEKVTFTVGERVVYRKKEATVIYGPYERSAKQMYELQLADGSVVSATATAVRKS